VESVCKINNPVRHETGTSEEGINPQRESVKTRKEIQARINTPEGTPWEQVEEESRE